jgi:energy-coupling factor transporter ATP-binding protein EcfA2
MLKTTKTTPNPYEEIATFKDGFYHFDFSRSRSWLEEQGKKNFGPHFRIYPEDHELLLSLLVYALGDREGAEKRNLDLKKGILLNGPIGCGKTTLITLVGYFFPPERQYQVKSAREISFEYEKEGYDIITRYGKIQLNKPRTTIWCFDDIGIEQPQKYFGNECNVLAEILLSRYELFVSKGIPTHVTTNLSASELEEKYGNRIRSRMREMFNLVAFDKNSKDKRS